MVNAKRLSANKRAHIYFISPKGKRSGRGMLFSPVVDLGNSYIRKSSKSLVKKFAGVSVSSQVSNFTPVMSSLSRHSRSAIIGSMAQVTTPGNPVGVSTGTTLAISTSSQ